MTDGNRLELAGGTGSRRHPVPHEVAAQVERALRQYEAEVDSFKATAHYQAHLQAARQQLRPMAAWRLHPRWNTLNEADGQRRALPPIDAHHLRCYLVTGHTGRRTVVPRKAAGPLARTRLQGDSYGRLHDSTRHHGRPRRRNRRPLPGGLRRPAHTHAGRQRNRRRGRHGHLRDSAGARRAAVSAAKCPRWSTPRRSARPTPFRAWVGRQRRSQSTGAGTTA